MKLEEFIEATLTQIVNGVNKAQQKANFNGTEINPEISGGSVVLINSENRRVESVEFDVAVTTEESTGNKGGAGIFIAPFGIGGQAETGSKNTSVSRVRFNVPIVFPHR